MRQQKYKVTRENYNNNKRHINLWLWTSCNWPAVAKVDNLMEWQMVVTMENSVKVVKFCTG